MTIFLVRHGKSDKSLQDKLPHDEFELKRSLVDGEEEKAQQLGLALKAQVSSVTGYDFVHSGKFRSKQTVLAIAKGFGVSANEVQENVREDFGLTYLAAKDYWHDCEHAIKDGIYGSHADFFLANPPEKYFQEKNISDPSQTFSAEYMQQNMRQVLRRAIERNIFLGNDVVVMVSHEPVISLSMSDLTGQSVNNLGGSATELEYARFEVTTSENSLTPELELNYRDKSYNITTKVFSL